MKNNHIDEIYPKLDEVKKVIKFGRREIVSSVKKSLDDFKNNFNHLEETLNEKNQEILERKDKLKTTFDALSIVQDKHNVIQNKYHLVSSFLNTKPIRNEALNKFKHLLSHDFIEFADTESSLAEEATALLILQDVEARLEKITSFPSIYNKNIVAVGGGFSAGKSEFINSFFIDKEIKLPVGINPVTAIPTYITVGKTKSIKG
jgi:DNA polymerase sigma